MFNPGNLVFLMSVVKIDQSFDVRLRTDREVGGVPRSTCTSGELSLSAENFFNSKLNEPKSSFNVSDFLMLLARMRCLDARKR